MSGFSCGNKSAFAIFLILILLLFSEDGNVC